MADKWVTMAAACQTLGISDRTLRRRIEQGKIKSKLENSRRLVLIDSGGHMAANEADAALIEQLRSEVEYLREELKQTREELTQSKERSDTIILQLTRQLENQQNLLEYQQSPFWKRWFRRKRTVNEVSQ